MSFKPSPEHVAILKAVARLQRGIMLQYSEDQSSHVRFDPAPFMLILAEVWDRVEDLYGCLFDLRDRGFLTLAPADPSWPLGGDYQRADGKRVSIYADRTDPDQPLLTVAVEEEEIGACDRLAWVGDNYRLTDAGRALLDEIDAKVGAPQSPSSPDDDEEVTATDFLREKHNEDNGKTSRHKQRWDKLPEFRALPKTFTAAPKSGKAHRYLRRTLEEFYEKHLY